MRVAGAQPGDELDEVEVTRRDLVVALDELLAGKPVSVPETKAFGCAIPTPPKE